jgi:hypothetical protein
LTIKIVETFDLGAELEKLEREAWEKLKEVRGQVIEADSRAPAVTKAEAETQKRLQEENKI